MKTGLLKRIGIASALGLALVTRAPSLDFKCTGDLSWDFFGANDASLSESARLVPIHPSDTYALEKNNGPVKDVLNSITAQNIKLRFGVEAQHKQFQADAGLGFGVSFISYNKEGLGLAERNYTNAPGTSQRGYGAALTYIDLEENGTSGMVINPFFRLGYQIKGKEWDYNLFGEYSPEIMSFSTELNVGYDRWNKLELLETRKLKTSLTNHFFKFGVGFNPKDKDSGSLLTPEVYVGISNPVFGNKEQGMKFGKEYLLGVTLRVDAAKLLKP
jgi:hypothetical protein